MKVQDLLQPLYLEANQQLWTLLLWDIWIINAINMALNDIYFYEWNHWWFMYKENEVDLNEVDDFITIESNIPFIKLTWVFIWDNYDPLKFDIVYSKIRVKSNSCNSNWQYVYLNSFWKEILMRNPKKKMIISYIGWFNRLTTKEDIIPVPDWFISALRNLSLFYILWPQWQYWEQKSWDLYNRWQEQLRQLSKSWLWQVSSINFKN